MKSFIFFTLLLTSSLMVCAQDQGFFLNEWQPTSIISPEYTSTPQTLNPVIVSAKIYALDTLTRIPEYLFGDNANLWTGCMSDNQTLMQYMYDRRMGVLRGPAGSVSDIFFWNYSEENPPLDIPPHLAGSTEAFKPWYGIKPYVWQNWTMATDSLYKIFDQTDVTGMLTVNYGYARYGTSDNPVAAAAHLAADWVRYDNGRTRFWEIGNEVFGSWEAGYRIDKQYNKDGQPEYITPELYATHSLVFIDSMQHAAAQIGKQIFIGLVMCDNGNCGFANWNQKVAQIAGSKADFFVAHSYFTPYNQNSTVETILNSYKEVEKLKNYIYSEVDKVSKPHLPIALTEYNIFATGSKQAVSHCNGMHAVLVTGEAIKHELGAALRWDLANGWSNGDDMGMYSYGNEPGVTQYAPRPAFYHLYFMRKFTGDVLLNSELTGDPNIKIYPTGFASGQMAVSIVNTSKSLSTIRLNIKDFKFGNRYFYYTLTGNNDDFSRKTWVNGAGTNLEAGGPLNYKDIKAFSDTICTEIKIDLPPLSSTFVLVEPGEKELIINDEQSYSINESSGLKTEMSPNPAASMLTIKNTPSGINQITILNLLGRKILTTSEISTEIQLPLYQLEAGIYIVVFSGQHKSFTKKLIKQ